MADLREHRDGSLALGWCRRPVARPLWLRGALGPVTQPRLAIVGSRALTAAQAHITARWTEVAARAGWAIWSGGALGVDAVAHRAALRLGAHTVAVLPAGFEPPTPPTHGGLFADIAEAGALLALAAPGTAVRRADFRSRNVVLTACVDALVVVAAAERSGSLHAASLAARAGLPVGVVPWGPTDANAAGGHGLLQRGCACLGSEASLRAWLDEVRAGTATQPPVALPSPARGAFDGARPAPPRALLAEAAIDGGERGWQRYAPVGRVADPAADLEPPPQPPAGAAQQVWADIERSGADGCSLETLASRLGRAQVAEALFELTLGGFVHCDRFGNYRTTAWAATTR